MRERLVSKDGQVVCEDLRTERERLADEYQARIQALEARIRSQRHQLRVQQNCLERKSRALDAMWWVWCSGGCSGGVDRYRPEGEPPRLTEEIVAEAERNTKRLRSWFAAHEWRKTPEYRQAVAEAKAREEARRANK